MNILVLSWRGPNHPSAGGAEQVTFQYAKGWVKEGHNVTLFTSYYPGARIDEMVDGVKIVRHGSQVFGVHLKAFMWYVFGKHEKYDLVIDQFHGIPFFTPLYVREKKLGFIHEVTKEIWNYNPWCWPFNLIPALIGAIFEPLVFKILYKKIPFMTVSESTKKDLERWGIYEKNIIVIHNGVSILGNRKYNKEKRKTVIFLGALSRDKGIEDALMVFSFLIQQLPNFQFWIIGKGELGYVNSLKLQANSLKINRNVKFWGFVSDKKKYELLARSHILICPSVREGWGLTVIEAAGMGTPTVGYNVAGLRDSIIDNKSGLLTKKNNPEEMARSVFNLMRDQSRYIRMCNYAKKWSSNFSWDSSIKQTLSLLKEVYENA